MESAVPHPAEPAAAAPTPRRSAATRTLSTAAVAAVVLVMPAPFDGHAGIAPSAWRSAGTTGAAALPGRPANAAFLRLDPSTAAIINARRPIDGALEAAPPFRAPLAGQSLGRAIDCLAAAALYEAGDDPTGQRAVAQVVLNRVRHPLYPKTVCGVVFEGSQRRTGCQFTFTCDGALARFPGADAWRRARTVAEQALAGSVDPVVGGATHYHADYVVPRWAPKLDKLATVGAHIFYSFPGRLGRKAAFVAPAEAAEPAIAPIAHLSAHHAEDGRIAFAAEELLQPGLLPGPGLDFTNVTAASAGLPGQARVADAHYLVADPGEPAGRWAVQALAQCRGKADCQVLAWPSAHQVDANRVRPSAQRDRPAFLFIRDRSSGMEVALWDCTATPRPDPSQCLPEENGALRQLMRARQSEP